MENLALKKEFFRLEQDTDNVKVRGSNPYLPKFLLSLILGGDMAEGDVFEVGEKVIITGYDSDAYIMPKKEDAEGYDPDPNFYFVRIYTTNRRPIGTVGVYAKDIQKWVNKKQRKKLGYL